MLGAQSNSRVITGGEFGFQENTLLLEKVFKAAILQYGVIARLYVDNGASFSSEYLSRVCASLGIGLVHSKPYDSPSRGKIERFFRTVREMFLSQFHPNHPCFLKSFTHLVMEPSDTPRSFATWDGFIFSSTTIRAAPTLNSLVYLRLVCLTLRTTGLLLWGFTPFYPFRESVFLRRVTLSPYTRSIDSPL